MPINLLRALSAASRVLPEILTYPEYAPVSGSSRSLQPGLLATIPGHLLIGGPNEALRAAFEADLAAIGLTAGQGDFVDRALAYAALLARWNTHIRLVGPTDLPTLVREQLVDALGFALAVGELPDESFWDIGAGGGLPGIPLALRFPERRFVMVEPIAKKSAFLTHAACALGLENVALHTGRVAPDGTINPPPRLSHAAPHAALSRATLTSGRWLETARRLVGPGGLVLIALAGEVPGALADDPMSSPAGVWRWTVPATHAPRTLLARRIQASPCQPGGVAS